MIAKVTLLAFTFFASCLAKTETFKALNEIKELQDANVLPSQGTNYIQGLTDGWTMSEDQFKQHKECISPPHNPVEE